MLGFFRRFAKSPLGLAVFGLIIIAFVVTLYEGRGALSGGTGGAVATVGGKPVEEAELTRRVQNQLDAERQRNPEMDMIQYVAAGGVDRTIELTATGRALELFAASQGMVASKKLIDGAIASIPAFNGPTGKFDQNTFTQVLQQRKLSEAIVRADFGREALTKMIAIPAGGAARVPNDLIMPYASLLLERRAGLVGVVPSEAFVPKTPPTDAEMQTYYQRNIARYTIPERRVLRFATFDKSRFAGKSAATDNEIQALYNANPAYAARDRRAFTQLILPTQVLANEVLGKIKGGMSMADAAKSIKRDALPVAATDKKAFEALTGPRVAEAAFATAKGQFAAVERSGLGFHVVRVDSIETVPATPLGSVRAKLAADVVKQKETRAIAEFVVNIEDEIGNNATFDEVAKKYALSVQTTPSLTSGGRAFDVAGYQPPAAVGAVLAEAFRGEPDDDPSVATLPNDGGYVVWKLDRTIPAAPRPLTEVRPMVTSDVSLDKGSKAAKTAADKIAAAVNAGTPLATALQAAGVPLPAPRPAGASRMELAQAQSQNAAPPPLITMFTMPAKRARVLQVDGKQGWFVVYLDKIERGDAANTPGLVQATQQQLAGAIGDEYVQQFAAAIRAEVGVKKDDAAIAKLKRNLTGAR